jgi:hypothetical protein
LDSARISPAVISVYLAHPYSKKAEGKRVQAEIEKLGILVVNPFDRGEQAIYDKKLAPGGGGLDYNDCAAIVNMDLWKIDETRGVVALLLDPSSIGTIMEIFYASHVKHRSVFSYAPTERFAAHPWIRYYSRGVYQTEPSLYLALKEWAAEWRERRDA